jgi:hypothetical protein
MIPKSQIKLNAAGNFVFGKTIGGSLGTFTSGGSKGRSIHVNSDKIIISGEFDGTQDFDPNNGVYNLTSIGQLDCYVLVLDLNGDFVFAKSFGGSGNDIAYSAVSDLSGNIFLGGYFNGTVDFDPNSGISNFSSNGSTDGFILKLSNIGDYLWCNQIGGSGNDQCLNVELDSQGNIYATGSFMGTVDFDNSVSNFNLNSNGRRDAFLVAYSSGGSIIYAQNYGGFSDDEGTNIFSSNNEIYLTGYFQNTVDFDARANSNSITSSGNQDAFILSLSYSFCTKNIINTIDSTPVTCKGGNNGVITIDATGGTEPYEFSLNGGGNYQTSNIFSDLEEGNYTVTVRDSNGCLADTNVIIGQRNDIPIINSLKGPSDPILLSSADVKFEAVVTDDNLLMATWDWGDGETSIENNMVGDRITGLHTYKQGGIYTVKLTIIDHCGETAFEIFEYVIVSDPSGGFVTGGGWFHSPKGAFVRNPNAVGRANFGFVSKYQGRSNVPTGQTQFQFDKLNFHSTSYEWLVVEGHRAQFKGEGRLNGQEGYGFFITVIDGKRIGAKRDDRFRIKIWELDSGAIVYDNQMNSAFSSYETTELRGGSIVIHKSSKGIPNNRIDSDIEDELKEAEIFDLVKEQAIIGELITNSIKIYPNPTSAFVNIQINLKQEADVAINIFDSAGRLIYSKESQKEISFINRLSMEGVSPGIYYIVVKINHQYIQKMLVKK